MNEKRIFFRAIHPGNHDFYFSCQKLDKATAVVQALTAIIPQYSQCNAQGPPTKE